MKFFKKGITLFLALALCLNFCGCGCFDRSWAIQCGDESLPTGVYVFFLMQAHQEAIQKLSQDGSTTDDLTNATIEGQSAPNWIVERSLTMCKEILVIEVIFVEMGLSLTEADEKQIQKLVDSIMSSSGTMFANSGISRADVQRVVSAQVKRSKVFMAIYGKDGSNPVSDEALNRYYKETYMKLLFHSKMPTPSGESGDANNSNSENSSEGENNQNQPVETDETIQSELNGYVDAINNGSKTLDQVREELKKSASAQDGAPSDPLVEQIINPNSPTLASEIAEKVKTLEKGKAAMVTLNNIYFLIYNAGAPTEDLDFSKDEDTEQKPESQDANQENSDQNTENDSDQEQESDESGKNSKRDNILSEMKRTEFEKKIKQKLDSLGFTMNYNALNQFNPLMFNKLVNAAA